MTDPRVGIIYHRDRHKSAKALVDLHEQDDIFADRHLPLSEALRTEWDVDAHLMIYRLDADASGQEWTFARASKRSPFVPQLIGAGGRVTVPVLVFDHDLPKVNDAKQPWRDAAQVQAFIADELLEIVGQQPCLEPTYWYTTLHGSRFVYALTQAVTHLEAEGLARGIMRDFLAAGLELDTQCTDWTRLFRLPKTVREDSGRPFHEDPTFLLLDGGPCLDPTQIEPAEPRPEETYAEVDPYKGQQPDPDEVQELLTKQGKNGRTYDSDLVRAAKTMLQGRDSYPVCFDHAPIDVSEGWNTGVFKLIGSVTGMLARRDEASPEGIYALLFGALEQLQAEEDRGHRATDWFETAWSMVARVWSAEQGQIEAEQAERAARLAQADADRARLVQELRQARPDDVPEDQEEADQWFRQRMIASDGRRHHVMLPDGNYNIKPVPDSLLVPMIKELEMQDLIPISEWRGKQLVSRPAQALLNDHATPITAVECSSREEHAHISGQRGAKVLRIPVHQLNPLLIPGGAFDERVDEWLQALGGDKYDLLIEWLSHSLDVKRAICALNLYGTPGTGKGMLAAGLAECFSGEHRNDGRALGKFNVGLLQSPIVNCDEGVPHIGGDEALTVDQAFRTMVTGGKIIVRAMRQDPFNAEIYPRILFTSNDRDIIQAIVGHRDLTDDDIRAIELRLLTIHADDHAHRLLTSRGNYSWTAGWVAGEQDSRYILANHILWLYEHRSPSKRGSNRLLVEGETSTELVREMRLRSQAAQAVLRALVQMVQSTQARPGMHVHEARVWVKAAGVLAFIEHALSGIAHKVTSRGVARVLRQFTDMDITERIPLTSPPGTRREQRGKWVHIDLGILYEEGLRHGMNVERIAALLEKQPEGLDRIATIEAHLPKDV